MQRSWQGFLKFHKLASWHALCNTKWYSGYLLNFCGCCGSHHRIKFECYPYSWKFLRYSIVANNITTVFCCLRPVRATVTRVDATRVNLPSLVDATRAPIFTFHFSLTMVIICSCYVTQNMAMLCTERLASHVASEIFRPRPNSSC